MNNPNPDQALLVENESIQNDPNKLVAPPQENNMQSNHEVSYFFRHWFLHFIDLKARAQAERNMQNEVNQIIGRSNFLKFVSGMVSSIKIVISSVFLSNFSEACDNAEITDWLILMMLHDCLNVFYVAFYMIYSKFFVNRRSILDEYEHQIRQQYQPLGEDGSNVQVNQNNEQHQDLVESQCKFLLVLKELNKM